MDRQMDKQKKKIMWAVLIIAFIQTPGAAISPGINQISTTAFSAYSLATVQTVLAFYHLVQPAVALGSAFLIARGYITNRNIVIIGLCLFFLTAVLALIINTSFWHLSILSVMLGTGIGLSANMFTLIFDNFEPGERQRIMGYQSANINIGGIVLSIIGGLLATLRWYFVYLVLILGLPAALLLYFTVPDYKTGANGRKAKKGKMRLHPKIYYYCVLAFAYSLTFTVCGNNLSTHISGIGDAAMAGIAVAFMMGGGAASGLFFHKLPANSSDYSISIGFVAMFTGYMLLSLFPSSFFFTFLAVFIVGLSLSVVMPRCIFMVSTLVEDPSYTATASALVVVVFTSIGSFLSPVIFTNLTVALYGESTAARYRFVSFVVLACALTIAALTFRSGRKPASGANA